MGLLAFSLQDQITKYGSYVGIAAFFGLAILSLLYFAQAREVRRLREWAGRAPERAHEVEALAVQHAEVALRTPTPAPQPVRLPEPAVPVAEPVSNGVVELKPEEIAALAFARAAGVRDPHAPHHHPPRPAQPISSAVTAGATVAAPAATNGSGEHAAVPAPATAAGNRPPVTPAPPRQRIEPLPPRRRSAAAPPPRENGTRSVVITAVVGVILLAVAAFGATKLFSSNNDKPAPTKTASSGATATATATAKAKDKAKAKTKSTSTAPSAAQVKVLIYNGTPQNGLAATLKDQLKPPYEAANIGVDTYTANQAEATSVVMYEHGDNKAAAEKVAKALDISGGVKPVDTTTQGLIDSKPQKGWNVVVIAGADRTS